jgi:hypothetical protein
MEVWPAFSLITQWRKFVPKWEGIELFFKTIESSSCLCLYDNILIRIQISLGTWRECAERISLQRFHWLISKKATAGSWRDPLLAGAGAKRRRILLQWMLFAPSVNARRIFTDSNVDFSGQLILILTLIRCRLWLPWWDDGKNPRGKIWKFPKLVGWNFASAQVSQPGTYTQQRSRDESCDLSHWSAL